MQIFEQKLYDYEKLIEKALDEYLDFNEKYSYSDIIKAMRYSALLGGKRIRPMILLEFCRICGGKREHAMPFAIALEMIHTYSLIHDDLPCMDDDDIRRGKPTLHKVCGEAMAVLAGDALLTFAFEIIAKKAKELDISPKICMDAILVLAENSGIHGMIGGQVIDILSENTTLSYEELTELQSLKTGALLRASGILGCIVAGASQEKINASKAFCDKLGLSFQIKDDLLDILGNEKTLGKPVGSDNKSGKATFPALLGVGECERLIKSLTDEALKELVKFEDVSLLQDLSEYLLYREK